MRCVPRCSGGEASGRDGRDAQVSSDCDTPTLGPVTAAGADSRPAVTRSCSHPTRGNRCDTSSGVSVSVSVLQPGVSVAVSVLSVSEGLVRVTGSPCDVRSEFCEDRPPHHTVAH